MFNISLFELLVVLINFAWITALNEGFAGLIAFGYLLPLIALSLRFAIEMEDLELELKYFGIALLWTAFGCEDLVLIL